MWTKVDGRYLTERFPKQPAKPNGRRLNLSREDSQITFYGDEERVRQGFAIALRAMGVCAVTSDAVLHATFANREDH